METIKILRNGMIFQVRPMDPLSLEPGGSRRYMGGFVGGLAGGMLDGGDEGGGIDYEQAGALLPEQWELLKALIGQINPGQGVTPYGGETVAGASPLQQSAFGSAAGYAPGVEAGLKGFGQFDPAMGGQYMGMGTEALRDVLGDFDPTSTQEAWQANMRPAFNMWRDEVVPAIQERGQSMTGTGDAGGIGREISRSGRDLTTDWSAILSNALLGGEQAHLGRKQAGINQATGMSQLPGQLALQGGQLASLGLGQMAGMGSVERNIDQQFLTADQQKWQGAQPYNNPWLQFLPPALGTSAFDTIASQGAPKQDAMGEIMPYAMMAMMSYMNSGSGGSGGSGGSFTA